MASGGGGRGVSIPSNTTLFPQDYFCYQCNRTISLSPSPSSDCDLICPHCNGGFLEELESPNPNPNSNPSPNPHPSLFNPFLSSSPFILPSSTDPDPIDLSAIFGGVHGGRRSSFHDSDVFNPFQFLQNYLHNMGHGSGTNFQFVIENADQAGMFRSSANMGDYFVGPGLEQLIQQLAENDPNRYGTPPASKSAIQGLPSIHVTKELLGSDSSHCAVCMDEFKLGNDAKQMPCKHVYHPGCILPWLELHNSCPICRYELPTDDPDYEHRAQGNQGSNGVDGSSQSAAGGNDGGEQENLQNDRTVERRFRISLPWRLRSSGSPAEASNSSADGNDGGQSNSRNGENPGFGSETIYEELD